MLDKKIIFVEDGGFGGFALHAHNICNALNRLGLNVTLVTNEDYEFDKCKISFNKIKIFKSLRKKPNNKILWVINRLVLYICNSRRLLRYLDTQSNYVLQLYSSNYFLNGLVCLFVKKNIRIISNIHDVKPHFNKGNLYMRLQSILEKVVQKRADKLVVFTDEGKMELEEIIKVNDKVVKIDHGMIILPRSDENNLPLRSSETLNLLCFGGIRPNKGYEHLIDAISLLPDIKKQRISLNIVGNAEQSDYFKLLLDKVAEKKLESVVKFDSTYVAVENVENYFYGIDLVILPYTHFHAQSGVVYLAHSFGIPVMVSDIGGLKEHIEKTEAGCMVPAADSNAIKQKLLDILENKKLLEQYKQNVQVLNKEYNMEWKKIACNYNTCYNT